MSEASGSIVSEVCDGPDSFRNGNINSLGDLVHHFSGGNQTVLGKDGVKKSDVKVLGPEWSREIRWETSGLDTVVFRGEPQGALIAHGQHRADATQRVSESSVLTLLIKAHPS
jgi:hypothetical protein